MRSKLRGNRLTRRAIAASLIALVVAGGDALACPVCAGRGGQSGADTLLIAIMLAAPVVLFGVGILCLRVLARRQEERES